MEHPSEDIQSTRLTRRAAVRAGLVTGAAVASTFLASTEPASAGVRRLLPARGHGDSAPSIQEAIDAAAATGGGTVRLARGEYLLGRTLQMRSGVTLLGAGNDKTVLRDHQDLGARPIIQIIGLNDQLVTDVEIADTTIRNGSASAGAVTQEKDGIVVSEANDVRVRNCLITEIQGQYGVRVGRTSGFTFTGNTIHRCTYAMLMLFPETEAVVVRQNTFDTVTSTSYPNLYLFATGYEALGSGEYYVRDVLVEHNDFLNNPLWIGINSHGGTSISIKHNYVENCRYGILVAAPANGAVTRPRLEDLTVEHNIVMQGGAVGAIAGINIDNGGQLLQAENVRIAQNTVQGYGGVFTTYGSITVGGITGVDIEENHVSDFGHQAICLRNRVFGATVRGNRFHNVGAIAPDGAGTTAGISIRDPFTAYGVQVDDNELDADTEGQAADWFIYCTAKNSNWQIGDGNSVIRAGQPIPYADRELLPVLWDSVPTSGLQQRSGDVVLDSAWRPRWEVASPSTGFGAFDTTSVIATADAEVGSTALTLSPADAAGGACLPPEMNVLVDGAGPAGLPLDAQVVHNGGSALVMLDRPAVTAVTGAQIRCQELVLREI